MASRFECSRHRSRKRTSNVSREQGHLRAAVFRGRQRLTLEGEWKPETRDLAAGALFRADRATEGAARHGAPRAAAPGSLAAWGWFNTAFERKEYMEAYVAECRGARDAGADPALAADFGKKVAEDAEFAKSPSARLEFFHRRHSSWTSASTFIRSCGPRLRRSRRFAYNSRSRADSRALPAEKSHSHNDVMPK